MSWKRKLLSGEFDRGTLVHKAFVASVEKASDGADADPLYTFVISTGQVDRHGDTIDVNGWDLEQYRANPVVLWQHDSYPGPIGSGLNVRVEDGVLKADVRFSKSHPLGQRARDLVEEGHLRAVSVGFRIVEYRVNEDRPGYMPMDILKAELWEFSTVSIPANPGALVDNAKGVEMPPDPEMPIALEALVASSKAGRVLSSANFDRLSRARDEINEVLAAAEPADDKATEGDGVAVLEILL